MKYTLFILLFGLLFMFSCDKDEISDSQADNFVKFYTNYPEFTAADVAVTQDGYAVLGTAKTFDGGTWICLLRTDKFGNTADTARLYGTSAGDNPANIAYCLKPLNDGGFAILGSVGNPVNSNRSVYFIRTNIAGDTLWTRTISGTGNLEARYFNVSGNESFYLTGYYETASDGKEIWWFGIDSEGNDIRNQRIFGFSGNDEGTHLQILPDGRLIITGYITRSSITKVFIIKTDENTVFEALYELPSSVNESGNCVLPLNADEYLLLGTAGSSSGSQMTLKRIRMSDTQQLIMWSRNYESSAAEAGRCLLNDGQSIYILGTTTFGSSNTSITLTSTDQTGNQTGRSVFGQGSKLSASSFQRTADGGFIVAGTNVHPEANNTSIALIKTR